jgi:hypothetical protein
MGGVILGGLVTSTVLSLFLVPALYLRFGYGQGEETELDLRDLWEVEVAEPALVANGAHGSNGANGAIGANGANGAQPTQAEPATATTNG